MTRYKSFVRLQDLMQHYDTQDIDDSHYDLSPSVLQKLKDQLSSLEYKYKQAEEEIFFLKFVDTEFHLGKNAGINPMTALFSQIYFYDHSDFPKVIENLQKSNQMSAWETVLTDLTHSFYQFLTGFLLIYESFLKGHMVLQFHTQDIQPHEIFKEWLLDSELKKLQEYQNDLTTLKTTNIHLTINYSVYDHYNNTGKTEIEKEERLCSLFKKIISTFFNLAETETKS